MADRLFIAQEQVEILCKNTIPTNIMSEDSFCQKKKLGQREKIKHLG